MMKHHSTNKMLSALHPDDALSKYDSLQSHYAHSSDHSTIKVDSNFRLATLSASEYFQQTPNNMARLGKRLRDGSESPAEQQPTKRLRQLSPIAEEVMDSASDCNPSTNKLRISTSSSSTSSPEPYFGSKQQKALSERTRRAERRSSQHVSGSLRSTT
jgi:hypothetical protein